MSDPQSAAIRFALSRKASGVCIRCGVDVDSDANWPSCKPCRIKHQQATRPSRNRSAMRRVNRHLEQGLCGSCKEPRAPGRRLCPRHLEMNREATRNYKTKKGKENPVLASLLAIAAAATRPPDIRSDEELLALRERCRKAEILKLGDILWRSTTATEVQVITAEIRRRLA